MEMACTDMTESRTLSASTFDGQHYEMSVFAGM